MSGTCLRRLLAFLVFTLDFGILFKKTDISLYDCEDFRAEHKQRKRISPTALAMLILPCTDEMLTPAPTANLRLTNQNGNTVS